MRQRACVHPSTVCPPRPSAGCAPPLAPLPFPPCRFDSVTGVPFEPFHLKREREEGYFDVRGGEGACLLCLV